MPSRTPHAFLVGAVLAMASSVAPAPAVAQGTGALEGEVTLRLPPPRRQASRYPGGAEEAHEVRPVSPVVYLEGLVEGAPPRPPSSPPVMAQHDTAFVPSAVVIDVGTTIRFPNEDPFFHNVFSFSAPARFDLGRYPRGEAKDVTFDKPGIVKVYCEVHDFMRSVIVVAENPFHAVAGAGGHFRIEGIPAGSYTFVFWHPDVDRQERTIQITAGETARVEVELRR